MEKSMSEVRFCKKCLLRDMDETSYFKNLMDYIEAMDAGKKVSKEEYERRLLICGSCDELISGMCKVCGCYVELRAVQNGSYCPAVHPLW